VIDSSLERHPATMASADAIENLIQGGLIRLSNKTATKVFLKGLMRARRSLTQGSMGALRHVSDLNAGHGAIMPALD
jgi:hypothetical protein